MTDGNATRPDTEDTNPYAPFYDPTAVHAINPRTYVEELTQERPDGPEVTWDDVRAISLEIIALRRMVEQLSAEIVTRRLTVVDANNVPVARLDSTDTGVALTLSTAGLDDINAMRVSVFSLDDDAPHAGIEARAHGDQAFTLDAVEHNQTRDVHSFLTLERQLRSGRRYSSECVHQLRTDDLGEDAGDDDLQDRIEQLERFLAGIAEVAKIAIRE